MISYETLTILLGSFLTGFLVAKSYDLLRGPTAVVIKPEDTKQEEEENEDEEWEDVEDEDASDDDDEEEDSDPKKMTLLVRCDLNMGKGKMCAQCGHASLGAHRSIHHKVKKNPNNEQYKEQLRWLNKWHHFGAAKVALKVDANQMKQYENEAKKRGLPTYRVLDAGKTQVEPGTATVVAIGPCPARLLEFTKDLKLL
ncbi:hypothetical protein C9374_004500 [Naegleria lovaniensis]|uniref:peptidyl-tRNA hydrolase n=1 Tax=Naegleria lovaniensis TaxID=51637 RepID=A0AA88KKM2_NAELO|nr:uncharacterized protein C9374_004500 [Naegleria lovaniensis]KAG2383163.1 hypothetical protein C9374_004500 [Naegleria lovaniensis]